MDAVDQRVFRGNLICFPRLLRGEWSAATVVPRSRMRYSSLTLHSLRLIAVVGTLAVLYGESTGHVGLGRGTSGRPAGSQRPRVDWSEQRLPLRLSLRGGEALDENSDAQIVPEGPEYDSEPEAAVTNTVDMAADEEDNETGMEKQIIKEGRRVSVSAAADEYDTGNGEIPQTGDLVSVRIKISSEGKLRASTSDFLALVLIFALSLSLSLSCPLSLCLFVYPTRVA